MIEFDEKYYQRFYLDPATRAVSTLEQARQVAFLSAYLAHLDVPVTSVLDIGCGLGQFLKQLGAAFPTARCTGVEYSAYLCERLGWEQASVVDYHGATCDLVVCNDVLAYLNHVDCSEAIENLARLTRQCLFLQVLTAEDLAVCDTEVTDMRQQRRSANWYRKRLRPHFQAIGGGLFLKRPVTVPVWQLESL
tara:strand:- start:687 stop:1262 length:576 start_codon:yes stop_codon:yes gene_type:complete